MLSASKAQSGLEMANCVNESTFVVENRNESLANQSSTLEESLDRIITGIALPAVCVFGIVGNVLNLTILTRRKLQKSFRSLEQAANLCLIFLAVSDLMFCVLAFLFTFLPSDGIYHGQGLRFYYGKYCTFLINVFIMESTMLTVAMSLERYMAICFPLRQDLYLTTRRIKYIIVGSFIFSLAFNVPVLWRFEGYAICPNSTNFMPQTTETFNYSESLVSAHFKENENLSNHMRDLSIIHNQSHPPSTPSSLLSKALSIASPSFSSSSPSSVHSSTSKTISHNTNGNSLVSSPSSTPSSRPSSVLTTSSSHERYRIEQVPLWGSQVYDLAYRICWALVGNFIPLALLFFFNVCLCRNIYLSYQLRRQFKRQNQAKSSSHILTVTLVVIVAMFFILVAPSEIVLLSGTSGSLEIIFNFMQSLNFSVNFILYCIISRHFRKTLKYLFLCGCYNIYQVSREWKKDFETSLM